MPDNELEAAEPLLQHTRWYISRDQEITLLHQTDREAWMPWLTTEVERLIKVRAKIRGPRSDAALTRIFDALFDFKDRHSFLYLARDATGREIRGAASAYRSGDDVSLDYMGTLATREGMGSALTLTVARHAASLGCSLSLNDMSGFFKSAGMSPRPGGRHGWTRDEVKHLVSGLETQYQFRLGSNAGLKLFMTMDLSEARAAGA